MGQLILKHGGYQKLKTFQLARLVYDITIRFCNKYIGMKSRTHDQMVQAARSGVQNIGEGSQASGTSKKTEIKLTNVARASLEELKLDYQDFLRQKNLNIWDFNDLRGKELIRRRIETADEFVLWVLHTSQKEKHKIPEIAANGILILTKVTCSLLDKQIRAQARAFEEEGGFTERLFHVRKGVEKK